MRDLQGPFLSPAPVQVATKFILMTSGECIFVGDQHAMDERVRLERLTSAVLGALPALQAPCPAGASSASSSSCGGQHEGEGTSPSVSNPVRAPACTGALGHATHG